MLRNALQLFRAPVQLVKGLKDSWPVRIQFHWSWRTARRNLEDRRVEERDRTRSQSQNHADLTQWSYPVDLVVIWAEMLPGWLLEIYRGPNLVREGNTGPEASQEHFWAS